LGEYQKRLKRARATISSALEKGARPYIAYSTGKDSTVMAHLVWEQAPDVPGVYFDADCAFPESTELIERESKKHTIIKFPTDALLDTLKEHGGPMAKGIGERTMQSTVRKPLQQLRKKYNFDVSFIGLRADESDGRAKLIQSRGLLFQRKDGTWECLPVGFFDFWDVWAYIISNGVDYNRAYDKMLDMPERNRRISYWAGETGVTFGRYSFLKRHYLDLYTKLCQEFPEIRFS